MDPPAIAVADEAAKHITGAPTGAAAIEDVLSGSDPPPLSQNGAMYFPYLRTTDPVTRPRRRRRRAASSPASSRARTSTAACGSRRRASRRPSSTRPASSPWGVHDRWAERRPLQRAERRQRRPRSFPGIGTVVFGARTLVSANPAFEQWRYVAVRRMALFIEQTLLRIAQAGRSSSRTTSRSGTRSAQRSTTSCSACSPGSVPGIRRQGVPGPVRQHHDVAGRHRPRDREHHRRFAPLKPAEFVVIKIAQLAGQSST